MGIYGIQVGYQCTVLLDASNAMFTPSVQNIAGTMKSNDNSI